MLSETTFDRAVAALRRYGVALLSVAVAYALTRALWPWVAPHPTPLFLAAVMLSALYAGLGPSLLATALAAFVVDYFFIPPTSGIEMSVDNAVRTGIFVAVALLISWIDEARKRAEAERAQGEEERSRLLVSEREARQEAEAASRAKDEFLAVVSHELRTPLSVITGWARLLRENRVDEETRERALVMIERNAELQRRLVEDLIDVSRIVSGRLHIDPRLTGLAAIVEDAVAAVALSARSKGIRISTAHVRETSAVLGDPERLQQVVWNLLSNAVKFTPAGGRVEVSVEEVGQTAELTVSDTGQGIGPELLPHVFERFRQGETVGAGRYQGLGLGLSIVRHLVEAHGGTVEAESAGEGHGATFRVRLPLAPAGPAPEREAEMMDCAAAPG